jgi:hypothetical protein
MKQSISHVLNSKVKNQNKLIETPYPTLPPREKGEIIITY